ncbi:Sodium/sulfate symporter [Blastocladiella britannica]|nr:Sodium/sulfate symporter [Blastocladiella britannica]
MHTTTSDTAMDIDIAVAKTKAGGSNALPTSSSRKPTATKHFLAFRLYPGASRRVKISRPTSSVVCMTLGAGLFVGLLHCPLFGPWEQRACFAVLLTASWLWATEALPLYVTAMLVPPALVLWRVIRDPVTHVPMAAHKATAFVFGAMLSPTIMLLMGGFAIAGALSKHNIAKMGAVALLRRAGTKSMWVLLANMMVATFASMWISNVAAPVLCFSIIQPILSTLPETSSFGSALVLGIALASNIGGMASPISSPQNVVAIANMTPAPTWLQWFLIALPICVVSNFIVWIILLAVYQPHRNTPEILPLWQSEQTVFTAKQSVILVVTLVTIGLWCAESALEDVVGDMGIIALLPIVVFYGSGILDKDDFNNMGWTVIMLAMGGSLLGKAVDNSGLLAVIATTIRTYCHGMSVWGVLLVFTCLMLVVATFVSHTVAALIVLPIVAEVGAQMSDPHPRLLVMGAALMCSGAMGLPVSGFPNMNAIAQEDPSGKPYLHSWDFIRSGVPGSIGVSLAVLTMGYGIMLWTGF